jgi:CheY-like chemotaxis protein
MKEEQEKNEVKNHTVASAERPLILIVEDDKFLRDIIVTKFKQAGFHAEEAHDGKQALEKLAVTNPKVILLDLLLPEFDGFEVLKAMKERPETEKIPVIVLSNLGQEGDIEKAKKLGARDFLIKAYVTPTEIVDRVKKILREIYF